MAISIGNEAINRSTYIDYLKTLIDGTNVANATGRITSISINARVSISHATVAIFYRPDAENYPNHFTARGSQYLGTVSVDGQTFEVDLEVSGGDFIGIYFVGGQIESTNTGGVLWNLGSNETDCENKEFGSPGDSIISLGGLGVTLTVTTQAVSEILSTTVKGNGNITYLGGENAHTRGFCYMEGTEGDPTTADSKVFDNGGGSYGVGAYSKAITGLTKGTGYRVRAYATDSVGTYYGDTVQVTTDSEPTVTTQAVSSIGDVTATGNGNITALGGDTPTKRGICYNTTGSPTVADSKVEETGEFGTGAFVESLINLSPETLYYAKAYAMNAVGYSYGAEVEFTTELTEYIAYGEWVKFITAAPGLPGAKPSGYKNDVCSDNSGYSYILNRSLTDDGASYESYFVLSTDLSGKKTLHTNKRLLDIFSYFANLGSGTAKIYVKCDTEPSWQYAGEISLAGEEEIIIRHLPSENEDTEGDVDFLAKTYLIKFLFENDFEFIGMITEAIAIGDR